LEAARRRAASVF